MMMIYKNIFKNNNFFPLPIIYLFLFSYSLFFFPADFVELNNVFFLAENNYLNVGCLIFMSVFSQLLYLKK